MIRLLTTPDASTTAVAVGVMYLARLGLQTRLLSGTEVRVPERGLRLTLLVLSKNVLVATSLVALSRSHVFSPVLLFGCFLFVLGTAVRLAALAELRTQYSVGVDLRAPYRLVTTGIYAIVRHPLYLGHLIDLLAFNCFLQSAPGAVVSLLIAAGWIERQRGEERAIRRRLGGEYDVYARRVAALNPFRRVIRVLRRPAAGVEG